MRRSPGSWSGKDVLLGKLKQGELIIKEKCHCRPLDMYPIKELGGKCNRKANYQISQAQDLTVTVLSRGGLDIFFLYHDL